MSDPNTTLWYLFVDQSRKFLSPITSIKVDKALAIEELKGKILAKHNYRDVDPMCLNIYRSNMTVDEAEGTQVGEFIGIELNKLGLSKKIGRLNIGEEEILLVELPQTTIHYLLIDQSHKILFDVTSIIVDHTLTIEELKAKIQAKHYRDVDPTRLNIYRVDMTVDKAEGTSIGDFIEKELNKLDTSKKIKHLNIGEEEILFVELPQLTINYLVFDNQRIIVQYGSIILKDNIESINDLRLAIKNNSDCFRDVAHDILEVYKSPKTDWSDDKNKLYDQVLKMTKDQRHKLNVRREFKGLEMLEEDVLLVKVPGIIRMGTDPRIWYRLIDHENNTSGEVSRVSASFVTEFQDRIKEKYLNKLRHVDAENLVVWRCKSELRRGAKPQLIKSINFNDDNIAIRLVGDMDIRSLGLADDEMLIVQMPCPTQLLSLSSSILPLGKTVLALRKEQLQEKLISSDLKSEQLRDLQRPSHRNRILCRRPPELAPTVPVTLLHPVLNEFSHDCETYQPGREDHRFARDLSAMSSFFEYESDRQKEFLKICERNFFQIDGHPIPGNKYCTDGSICSNGWPCLVAEIKLEAGSTGAEPVFQAAAYYRVYLKEKGDELDEVENYTFPCIGMYIIGPLIGFFGMAFTTYVNLQMLGQPLRLDCHDKDEKQWEAIARHLGALRRAVDKLKKMYNKETPQIPIQACMLPTGGALFFPVYSCFEGLNGSNWKIKYSSQPFEGKLFFYGTYESDSGKAEDVCIKFVNRYSLEGHKYCASGKGNFAPRLVGSRVLPGGWMMVVMERLDGCFKMLSKEDCRSWELYEQIDNELGRLHQAGYVHGDIRDLNIMVKNDSEGYSFKLVDWDWAGKIGEVRYPRNVGNAKELRRPQEVYDGELIKAEHDKAMLQYIFREIAHQMDAWWVQESV